MSVCSFLKEINNRDLPANTIKLVFFDIDGTLIDASGDYSKRTKSQISRIQKQGIKTAIASGRPYYATDFLQSELSLVEAGLYCSGAMIYAPQEKRLLHKQVIERDLAKQLYRSATEFNLYCELYGEHEYYFEPHHQPIYDEIQQAHSKALRLQPQRRSGQEVLASSAIIKLLIGACDEQGIEKIKQLECLYPQCKFAYAHMASHPDWLFASVLNGAVSKEEQFRFLCDYHGVDASEVMAIGDAQSDMDFLRLAGIGVAMGNANDEVQQVADYVTLSVTDSGAAYALARIIPEV